MELSQNGSQQLFAVHARVEDQSRAVLLVVELLQQRAAQSRLARADLARDLDEPLPLTQPEEKVIERLPVLLAEEQEARVRRDVERRLPKAVEVVVHV